MANDTPLTHPGTPGHRYNSDMENNASLPEPGPEEPLQHVAPTPCADQDESVAPPAYKLYNDGAVGLATFFGSPLAGSIVLAINYKRLGKSAAAWKAVLLGTLGTALLVGIGIAIDNSAVGSGIGIGVLVGMMGLARSVQGPVVAEHVSRGGRLASGWGATGIGVLTVVLAFVLALAAIVGVVMFTPSELGQKASITNVEEVYYAGESTEADARKLGEILKTSGFFDGNNRKSVALRKDKTGNTISFALVKDFWNKPDVVKDFTAIGQNIADNGFGRPLTIHLCNRFMQVQKEIKINPLSAPQP